MSSRSSGKSNLLLLEIILVVLFFAAAGAVCVGLFVRAHLTAENSRDLGRASTLLQTKAEQLRAAPLPEGEYRTYYGGDWQEAPASDAAYLCRIQVDADEGLPLLRQRLELLRLRDGREVLALTTAQWEGGGASGQN